MSQTMLSLGTLPRPSPQRGSRRGPVEQLDLIKQLLAGRTHFRRVVPDSRGAEPIREVVLAETFSTCEHAMEPVLSDTGHAIGFRCPACGTTASKDGTTEHGPRWLKRYNGRKTTVVVEPGYEDKFRVEAAREEAIEAALKERRA